MPYELGIIGAGNMAEAIARGVLRGGLFRAEQLIAADVSPQRRDLFQQLGIRAVESNLDAAREARVLLLSVKPQQMADALGGIGTVLNPDALVVSIAAGITTAFIEQHLAQGRRWRVVRTMPNTPMLVGEGITALAPGAHATADDVARARRVFEAGGAAVEVREELLDAVTALSGSGPAYFFYLAEHMIAAGVAAGLTPEQSRLLVTRTAVGAAKMLAESPDSPQELRRKVTSPGGTTQAAVTVFDDAGLPDVVKKAILAARDRGRELKK